MVCNTRGRKKKGSAKGGNVCFVLLADVEGGRGRHSVGFCAFFHWKRKKRERGDTIVVPSSSFSLSPWLSPWRRKGREGDNIVIVDVS